MCAQYSKEKVESRKKKMLYKSVLRILLSSKKRIHFLKTLSTMLPTFYGKAVLFFFISIPPPNARSRKAVYLSIYLFLPSCAKRKLRATIHFSNENVSE